MVRGLVVTHGRLGEALIAVVEGFLGPQEALSVLSNDGLSAADLKGRVEGVVRALAAGDELFLLTDLDGGSCGNACAYLARADGRCYGLSGLNLPMLLEFCHYRERLSGESLLERIKRKAQSGIVVSRSAAD